MKILMRALGSDEYDLEVVAVFVDMDNVLAKRILKRAKLFRDTKVKDILLLKMSFGDTNAIWLSSDKVEDCMPEGDFHTQEHAKFDFTIDDDTEMECERMVIDANGVYWTAVIRHTETHITTITLPFSIIEAAIT